MLSIHRTQHVACGFVPSVTPKLSTGGYSPAAVPCFVSLRLTLPLASAVSTENFECDLEVAFAGSASHMLL